MSLLKLTGNCINTRGWRRLWKMHVAGKRGVERIYFFDRGTLLLENQAALLFSLRIKGRMIFDIS
jgi:hypothetical protein